MLNDTIDEARRQIHICNACRYCEGLCNVFPAMHAERNFSDADITQLANLCHNCRGCYYACQFTAPHEFELNLPDILAKARYQSWENYTWPRFFARIFTNFGLIVALALIGALALSVAFMRNAGGGDFYTYISHEMMLIIFVPAFLFPFLAVLIAICRYWRSVDGGKITPTQIWKALKSAAHMKNLSGGHGEGCNFEDEDRYSQWRRYFHQATMYGFLLCFASTSSATIMHYVLDMPAPYGFFSPPKLFGVTGGIALSLGTAGLGWLKLKADPHLGDASRFGGEMAFIVLLFLVSSSGLALYAATGTMLVAPFLAFHLSCVFVFFLTLPYSKMMHGIFRLAALIKDASQKKQ